MHPKNPFNKDYNFKKLIDVYPALKEHSFINKYGTTTIDFSDQKAVKALNSALLKLNYAIEWHIPEENLCPPIPGRLDYLLYVNDQIINNKNAHVLDIGFGANLIYPILAKCHFNWNCTGTEIDIKALENAEKIIKANSKLKGINLRLQRNKDSILKGIINPTDKFDVIICNPPFYKNKKEAKAANTRKTKNLRIAKSRNFGGLSNELWYPGGEVAFVSKMIEESKEFKNEVKWFTSLVSKKESLAELEKSIKAVNPTQFKTIDMGQGNKISRFIAWSFK